MSAADYQRWLADPSSSRKVLMHLEAEEKLVGWTQVGVTSAYSCNFYEVVEADVVPGGLFAELVGVVQDSIELVLLGTLAAVQAAPGSYTYDKVTKVLYVHATTGVDPDVLTYVAAIRRMRFSTAEVNFLDQPLYYPLIVGSVPTVRDDAEKSVTAVNQLSSGEVTLQNGDKQFDRISATWFWRNRWASFYFGGGDLIFSDYVSIGRLAILDIAPGDDVFTLKLGSAEPLDRGLPINSFRDYFGDAGWGSTYPEELQYQYMPMLWGKVRNASTVLYEPAAAGGPRFLMADPLQVMPQGITLTKVRARNKTTGVFTTITPANYVNGGFYISQILFDPLQYDIFFDGYRTAIGYEKMGDITKDLLLWAGVDPTEIDAATVNQANIDAPFVLGLYIPGGSYPNRMLSQALQQLCESVIGRVFIGSDGLWKIKVWDPTVNFLTATQLVDEDMLSWDPDVKLESVVWRLYVLFDYSTATDSYKNVSKESVEVKYKNRTTDTISFKTLITEKNDAAILAARLFMRLANPSVNILVRERGAVTMGLMGWDKLLVTRRRAPSGSGVYAQTRFEVLSIRKSFSPTSEVEMLIGNISGLGSTVGVWTGSPGVAFAVATEAEKNLYGFWSDNNGLLDGQPGPVWW